MHCVISEKSILKLKHRKMWWLKLTELSLTWHDLLRSYQEYATGQFHKEEDLLHLVEYYSD